MTLEEATVTSDVPVRPAYDAELASSLRAAGGPYVLDFDDIDLLQKIQANVRATSDVSRGELEALGLVVLDHHALAHDGYRVPLHHVFSPSSSSPRPCIIYIHGGGMIMGTPWDGVTDFPRWIADFGVSVVTVDYRLAPTAKAPTLVEDCYAALRHVHASAAEWGIDPAAIVVAGMSAGGGLAAGTAVLARDRGGPALRGQLLMAPMLDPDSDGDSMRQQPSGPWNREENSAAWKMVLDGVPENEVGCNAPGRVPRLGDLPPALLEVGSAEIFRTEVIDYAGRIWQVGGDAELHVWSGGFHGFQSYPHAAVTQAAIESRRNWLGRLFGYGPQEATQHERSAGATGAER
ncbi:alpha/beta hydrolase [Microbacterium sp. LWH12-1.2]|uniref:alpha/beta hydrolase n=1 Tax=Microbacterium sp. LWH12-1.2 TaxID=3135259 RepID=UPI00341AD9D0